MALACKMVNVNVNKDIMEQIAIKDAPIIKIVTIISHNKKYNKLIMLK